MIQGSDDSEDLLFARPREKTRPSLRSGNVTGPGSGR